MSDYRSEPGIADVEDFDTFQANFLCYVARGGRKETSPAGVSGIVPLTD